MGLGNGQPVALMFWRMNKMVSIGYKAPFSAIYPLSTLYYPVVISKRVLYEIYRRKNFST
jgi:hypothetical protein